LHIIPSDKRHKKGWQGPVNPKTKKGVRKVATTGTGRKRIKTMAQDACGSRKLKKKKKNYIRLYQPTKKKKEQKKKVTGRRRQEKMEGA